MDDRSAPTYHNLINGEWVPAASGEVFENRNPANTDDLIGRFAKSSRVDAERAIAAPARAYESWRLVPAPKRAEILYRAAQLLVERKERLARDMTREMGKVLEEARGDLQEAIDMAFFMAGEGRRQHGQTAPSELRDKFAMSTRQPIGVCGIITPWNFPMAIPSWKILPALVCGAQAAQPATFRGLPRDCEGCSRNDFPRSRPGTSKEKESNVKRYVVNESEGVKGKLPGPGGGGTFNILIDEEASGAKHFSLLVNEMAPGYKGKEHSHTLEHCWYILNGTGIIRMAGETYHIKPGDAVFAPIGMLHTVECAGNEPLRYVVIYAPPGPEKELRSQTGFAKQ